MLFCARKKLDPLRPSVPVICEFSHSVKGSCFKKVRTAISWIIDSKYKENFCDQDVAALIHGEERSNPVLPALKTDYVWDPEMVLDYFRSLPQNKHLSIPLLGKKTVTLIMLATARRQVDIAALSLLHMRQLSDKILLNIPHACKTYKCAFFMNQMITLEKFDDSKVCAVRALKKYLSKTRKLRNSQTIFITQNPPYKGATSQTLRRWIRDSLTAAGVDMRIFNPYSTHAVAASKEAFTSGPLKAAMDKGQWRSENSFYCHYLCKVTYFNRDGSTAVRHPTQPPQANLAPVSVDSMVKYTARRLVRKAHGLSKPTKPIKAVPKKLPIKHGQSTKKILSAFIKRTGPTTHVYAVTEPLDNPPDAEVEVHHSPPSPANTTAYEDIPPQVGGNVTIPIDDDNTNDIVEIPPPHPDTPSTVMTTSDYAPNLELTVDVSDSISQRGSPPPPDKIENTQNSVTKSLQMVSEHCYSNNSVLNLTAQNKCDVELRNHQRIHKYSKGLMPPPPPPPAPLATRTILNMPDGDYLTSTKPGFELANSDQRTLPHGNARSVRVLRKFPITDCRQMSVSLGTRKYVLRLLGYH